MRLDRAALSLALAIASSAPGGARGEDRVKPTDRRSAYSAYERRVIDTTVRAARAEIDPSPEGKIVEEVIIVRLPVFDDLDPLPKVLAKIANFFHVTSQDRILRREVLLTKGMRYDRALVDETERNLRRIRQLSLVLTAAVKGSAPGRVRLIVIAKDVWSLRLNSDFRFKNGVLEKLLIQPSEENVAGLQHAVLATFQLDPKTYTLGLRYRVPRILDSYVSFDATANVILNRGTGKFEGTTGALAYGQPLYTTRTEWAWGADISWSQRIRRRYIGPYVASFDAKVTPEKDFIPYQFKNDQVIGSFAVTRSFGRDIKHDVTLGVGASRNVFRPIDTNALRVDSAGSTIAVTSVPIARAARDEFIATALPVSDTRIGPRLQYRSYTTRFVEISDVDIMGLQENYRVGHDVYLGVRASIKALGSSRNFGAVYAAAAYTLPLGDGFARAYVETDTAFTAEGIPDGMVTAGLRLTTPRFYIGRLTLDALVVNRYANYLNERTTLGGDTRLRGYPSEYFIGKDLISANLEFRSRPFELFTIQVGGVLFFDVGDAFDGFSNMRLKQGMGFGLRALLPQLDRTVLRIDWGFPLTKGVLPPSKFPGDIVVTFSQAFSVPSLPTGF